jgi:hypothetical protein
MPKNKNWVKWRKHAAREIILQDLNYGGWLYDEMKDGDLNLAIWPRYLGNPCKECLLPHQ